MCETVCKDGREKRWKENVERTHATNVVKANRL